MRFGTYYFLQAPPSLTHAEVFRRELEQMAWTEELGFDSIWLTEHHFIEYGLSVSPAVLAAAVAMRTQRVRIGLAAAILPFHDPVRLAEEMAMVDILCGGRLDVGVGRGNRPVEFEGYRVPQIENRERFEEALAIMIGVWTRERFSYAGRHYAIPEVRVIPKPLQQPHPPLYVVCTSPDTIEATALRGLPMLNSWLRGPIDQLVSQRDAYLKACQKAGRTDAETASLMGRWGVSRHIYVAPTDALAQAEAKDAEMWYQEALRRFLIPDDIDRVHPLLQPGFRTMKERLAKITWDQLGRRDGRVRLTRHGGREDRSAAAAGSRRGPVLDELRRPAPGAGAPLHGAVRPRGHAPVSASLARPHRGRAPAAFAAGRRRVQDIGPGSGVGVRQVVTEDRAARPHDDPAEPQLEHGSLRGGTGLVPERRFSVAARDDQRSERGDLPSSGKIPVQGRCQDPTRPTVTRPAERPKALKLRGAGGEGGVGAARPARTGASGRSLTPAAF